jgi:hypothetical protein
VIASGEKLAQKLEKKNWRNQENQGDKGDKYFVSDLTEHFEKLASKILGKSIRIEKTEI